MAMCLSECVEVAVIREFECEELAVFARAPGNSEHECLFEKDAAARLWRLAGANLRDSVSAIDNTLDHDIDLAAAFLLTEQACLDDLGVVENEQIARGDELWQVGKAPVVADVALHVQQATGRAFTGRMLGDQFGWKWKIEVVEGQHFGKVCWMTCSPTPNQG